MTDPYQVLVIEDDPQLQRFLKTSLEVHGYGVSMASTGNEGLASMVSEKPDVVLLDLGLPDLDGASLISNIRQWSRTPILVVSSRARSEDKINALDNGANDYVTKPFDMGELLARIRATLRQQARENANEPIFVNGPLEVDLMRREVRVDGRLVKLSPREYELLRYLVINADKVMTHQMLLSEVWGPAHVHNTHYLRIFIGRLRQKIEANPAQPQLLITEPGVGYRLRMV